MPSLRARAVTGVKWGGLSALIISALQFGRLAILAHLLRPRDFGLVGMVMIIIGLGQAFSDMGMSNAIIWRQDASRDQLSSLYWLNITAGAIVFGLVIAVSPLVSAFYREPRLRNLIFLSAFVFLIIPFGQQFQMLMQKDLLFRQLAAIEIFAAAAGTAVAITTAVLGCGVYSLIYGQLTDSSTRTLTLAWVGWREWQPRFHLRLSDLKGFIRFGLFQMGERSLNFFAFNVDYIMVGRFLGPTVLGIYMLAYQLVVLPFSRINPVLTKVAFPIFAKKQADDRALSRGYLELSKVIALVTVPILAILVAISPVLVPVIFGAKWNAAIPLIQILSMLGIFTTLGNPIGSILLAKGRADVGFMMNSAAVATFGIAFWFAAQHGVFVMAWTEVIVSLVFFIVTLAVLRAVIGLKQSEYLHSLTGPLSIGACTGAAVYGAYSLLGKPVGNKPLLLTIMVALGGFIYVFLSLLTERDLIRDYWRHFVGRGDV